MRDLRVQFGDYAQATVSNTDNTMRSRTQGCIALLPTGNLTGLDTLLPCVLTDNGVMTSLTASAGTFLRRFQVVASVDWVE